MAAQAIALPEFGLLVGLVGAGQDEGVSGEIGRLIDDGAEQGVGTPAVGPVDLMEQDLVVKVGIPVMCRGRGDADLDLVAQHAALDDVPCRDADENLDQFVSAVE